MPAQKKANRNQQEETQTQTAPQGRQVHPAHTRGENVGRSSGRTGL